MRTTAEHSEELPPLVDSAPNPTLRERLMALISMYRCFGTPCYDAADQLSARPQMYLPSLFSDGGWKPAIEHVLKQLREMVPARVPIAYKLALVIALLISSGMVLLGVVVIGNQTQLLQRQTANLGMTVARQLAESAKEPLLASDSLSLQFILNNIIADDAVLGAAVYSEEGEPVMQAGLVPADGMRSYYDADEAAGETAGTFSVWTAEAESGQLPVVSFLTPVVFRDVLAGYAQITFSRALMEQSVQDSIRAIVAATILLVLLGFAGSIVLGKRLSRPIHDLMDASREISRGNYGFRFRERRNDELGTLMEAFSAMTEGLLRKEQVERAFSRYVSPSVAKQVLANVEQVRLGGQHVEASVLFADIVGFTKMSETMTPHGVSKLLNEYFSHIAAVAHSFQGHIDKYMGDCAMIVFGVPEADNEHCYHAVACAVAIQQAVNDLNDKRRREGLVPVEFRIGINSGLMLAGNMGSNERMEYTVVGDAVNLASRLSSAAGPGQIIISEEMNSSPPLRNRILSTRQGTIQLRGKTKPVAIYHVLDVIA